MESNDTPRVDAYLALAAGDAALDNHPGLSRAMDRPAFDGVDFNAMREMVGETGIREMVEIFETETRQRLRRLAAGQRDAVALAREMHTLKGSAGMVASPRLRAFGEAFERAAQWGIAPTPDHLEAMEAALEHYLAAVRAWTDHGACVV